MVDYQLHLKQLTEQQKELTEVIQKLSFEASEKRDVLLKVQGAIEYIQQVVSEQAQNMVASESTEE